MMLTKETGTWLRQQREARGWARRDMARRLIQAGHAAGDTAMPGIDSLCTYIRRWEHGHGITERYKLHYCAALAVAPAEFGLAAPNPAPVAPVLGGPRLPETAGFAYRGTYRPEPDRFTVEREVLMTAHEGRDHSEEYERPGIGDRTLEELRADVARLSHLTDTGQPFPVFLEMRRVRDRIYRLLDRRLWPREQADLLFLLGCLNCLMGVAANRLGYPDAAEELLRAGLASAGAIDNKPLQAQLRQELAYVTYWRGSFTESLSHAASGLESLSTGPSGALLYLWHARAAARMGDDHTARRAIAAAHHARDIVYSDDVLEIGGEFAVSRATHHYFAGAALAGIRGAEGEAAAELERAIGYYDEGPGEREEHCFSGKPLAGIDLAVLRLRVGALDAAAVALEPLWSLSTAQRISSITTRLARVRDELAVPVFRGSAQARALGERIEEFGRETIVAGLHSLPG
jgi:hypothetical protein